MTEQSRYILSMLSGDHVRDHRAQMQNWFTLWLPVFGSYMGAGMIEAFARGWRLIEVTPISTMAACVGAIAGAAWIRAANSVRHRFTPHSVERIAPWPLRAGRFGPRRSRRCTLALGAGNISSNSSCETASRRRWRPRRASETRCICAVKVMDNHREVRFHVASITGQANNALHQTGRGGAAVSLRCQPVVEARPAGEAECSTGTPDARHRG